MSDGPEWFAPKRYGYGAGLPISWQGWAVVIIYVAVVMAAARFLPSRPAFVIGVVVPMTAILIAITSRTTRGGWRWRWGDKD